MDSLFISELTHLNIYIIKAEHMFSIYERKSYFLSFFSEGVDIFLHRNHSGKDRITEPFHQLKANIRPEHLREFSLVKIQKVK